MGVHEFDVIRWLTGQAVTSVVAVQTPALDPAARPDVDNAQALLGLSGGATAAVSLGRHYPGGDLVTIEVFGSAGHERSTVLHPDDGDEPMLDALASTSTGSWPTRPSARCSLATSPSSG